MKRLHGLFLTIFLLQFGLAQGWAATNDKPVVDQYVSVGDNWFLGRSMAVDSDTAIRDVFDFFKNVFNSERIYWRGLQAAVATDQLGAREDNFMYAGAFDHFADLIDEDIERRAVEIAHEEGLELWGVTQFGDYGVTADTPNFNEYPGFWEAKLRQENPEWIPTDKYGYRKQGGVIELAYPEARKALVDLHVELIESAGYDGIIFMSYAENFSMRFQDEFGYSEPIVQEFKRRHGIDIRTEPFNKFATRQDWYRLRGEYVTAFMEELREALGEEVKIGVWLNPIDPRKPMVWATLPQEYYTIGIIHMDIDKWVRDGIVDELGVYGGSSVRAQDTTLDEMLFLSRDTDVEINFITSNPFAMSRWKRFYELGMRGICSLGDEIQYLNRCMIPEQTKNALQSGTIYEKMKFLSQVIEGHSSIDASEILPLLDSPNVIMQRLTLQALGKIGDPASVPAIESALFDPEQGVRSMAIYALGYNQGPNSLMAIEACMEEYGNHHLLEMTRNSIPRFSPVPYDGLHQMLQNPDIMVRRTAMYSLSLTARPEDLPYIEEALYDDDRYVAFLAARSLGMPQFRQNELAHEIMLSELNHPDPAIQNRVATSVGDLAYHGYDGPLRSQMLDALRSNFLELGTGTDRIDSEWGHRAIGNAMIGFGPEGEAELADLKATADDPRIRELAWQVIYFREKTSPFANEFNIITEKENEEAYRQRPVSLKDLRIDYLNQDFDDSRIFQPDSDIAPTVGDVHTKGGRWGGFGKNGAFIENKIAKSGRQSLHLKRGGSQVIGWTTNGPTPGWDFVTELWIQRNDVGSFSLRIMDDTKTNFLSILVDGDGRIRLSNPEGSPAWVPTDLTISPNEWTLLKITFEVSAGFITIQSREDERGTPNSITIPFEGPNSSPTRILFTPNVPEDSSVFIDDIAIYEVR